MSLRYLSKTQRTIGIAAAAVLVIGACVGAAFVMRPSPPPVPGDDLVDVVKFVKSDQYEALSEAEKMPYMKRLRQETDQLRAAVRDGRITTFQYQQAALNGWMCRQLDNMDEYYSMPAAVRDQQLIAKYARKSPTTSPSAAAAADPHEPTEEMEDEFIDDRVSTWPPEEQAKWEAYRKAVKSAKSAAKARGK